MRGLEEHTNVEHGENGVHAAREDVPPVAAGERRLDVVVWWEIHEEEHGCEKRQVNDSASTES